ncbi:penicillin-binding transpeptidase domain-containing protein [Halobacillus litoralis]|uniref:penicillin-binding transpeptidase domain-containing protein n=1 Tax=Halobacillus litoralis TaxID=45668 RepID=UPI002491974D|nr:penicillin-binding transpeptidase domain-containing protein [Halobacillus litoralis]
MKRWILVIFSLLLLGLTACSEQPNPEDTFTAYMKAWESGEYAKMYGMLSKSSQGLMSEEEFVDRYTAIYEGIGMKELAVTYELPEEDQEYDTEEKPSFEYGVSMGSLGGEIQFSHSAELVYEEGEEENRWAVDWSSSMIFPEMEEGDTVRAWPLSPERGEIFDVDGKPLAVNGGVKQVGIAPGQMEKNSEEDVTRLKEELAEILNISVEYIDEQLGQSWVTKDTFVPLASINAEDEETIDAINELPSGISFQDDEDARRYPLGEAAAHLTGYVDEVTAEDLDEHEGEGYSAGDQIGRRGLESVMEDKLRGKPGGIVVIRNKEEERKTVLAETPAKDGEDVTLTISSDVQRAVYEQMKGDSGAASAIDPRSGEVKALVSTPSYDPNEEILNPNGAETTINKFNKTYSPGSTFKPITAAIGLETGNINPEENMAISGKTYSKDDWGGYKVTRVDGAAVDEQVNLRDALMRSDNIYFARSILKIGGETFMKETDEFGFGEDIPFPYPIQSSQILNGEAFDNEALLADTGYGQGQVQMSPLHLAMTYTPFVTNGTMLKPTLLKEEETGQTWHENIMSEETAAIVRERLKAVVQDSEGTAHDAELEGRSLAGKTGTAELKQSLEDENGQENGWFIAWVTENPDLMISMMIEDVDEGSHYVVPKVRNVFEQLR